MSVIDQLNKFRYSTTTRELPMALVRSIDMAKQRAANPDLQLMKHLTSSLSDCAVPSAAEVAQLTPVEVQQVVAAFQLSLQFTLHSQGIMREQLTSKSNAIVAEKITAQQMAALEAKVELSKKKLDDAAAERQSMQVAMHALEKRVAELATANALLDRELEFHRGTQRLMTTAAAAATTSKSSEPAKDASAGTTGDAPRSRCRQHSASRVREKATDDDTATSDSSVRPKRHSRRDQQRFVDWQSFSGFLMSQQQQQLAAQQVAMNVPSPVSCSQRAPDNGGSARSAERHQEQHTSQILSALRTGLQESRDAILQQTHAAISNVEAGLADRMANMQQELRKQHDSLATQVQETDKKWEGAFEGLSGKVTALQEDTQQQIRLLKLDFSTVVSRQTSVGPVCATPAPLHAQGQMSGGLSSAGRSPSALPPLPLAQVLHDTSVPNNSSGRGAEGGATAAAGIAASPVMTPGGSNAGAGVFGPRMTSTVVSNDGNDATSDDDDDDPYIPISQQQVLEPCQHCRERFPLVDVRRHEASCDLRLQPCTGCGQRVVVRMLPEHRCPSVSAAAATQLREAGKYEGRSANDTDSVVIGSPSAVAEVGVTPSATSEKGGALSSVLPLSATALSQPAKAAGDASLNDTSLNSSNMIPMTRKPSSQMLKDTQDELQRLLEEDAAEEARKAAVAARKA